MTHGVWSCFFVRKFSVAFFLFVIFSFFYPVFSGASDKYGGEIILSTTSDPKSFNDILAKETSTSLVTSFLFEGLTTTNAYTTKVEPHLAQSWQFSEDGLVCTFYLRQDVKWHDGKPFTADDVVFTFNELIFNPDIPTSSRDIFTIEGKPLEVLKVDDFTVKFVLPVKFAPFLRAMGQSILPKHKLEEVVKKKEFNFTWGIDTDPKEIVGTGAFKFVRYDPGQRLIFERNPLYWKRSQQGDVLPYLNKVIYLIVPNVDVQLLKFIEGTTDAYGLRGMDYPLLKPLEKKNNFTVYDLGPDMGSQFIFFNQNPGKNPQTGEPFVDPVKFKWFANLDFRKAVAHAIDKEKMIDIVKNGLGYPQDSAEGPGAGFFYNPDVMKYEYSLDKSREYLRKINFFDRDGDGFIEDESGNRIEFTLYTNAGNTERVDIAGIIRHDLEKLGMKVNFQALEFNTLVGKLSSTFDWEVAILGLTGGIEPHFGKNVWSSKGQLHMWYPSQEKPATQWEARIDQIFNEAVQELDENKRKKYYDEFQMVVSENVPLIYTVLDAKNMAVKNKFGNLRPTNYGGAFHNIEELYILKEHQR